MLCRVFNNPLAVTDGYGVQDMCGKTKVMIYSQDLGGHRQIHCANWIHYFLQKGCQVYLATAGFHGRSWREVTENPYLGEYLANQNVHVVNIADAYARGGLSKQLGVVADLQTKYTIDYTLFAFADSLTDELASSALPWSKKLKGKNYGIFFLLSNYIYQRPNEHFEGSLIGQVFEGLRRRAVRVKSTVSTILFLNV